MKQKKKEKTEKKNSPFHNRKGKCFTFSGQAMRQNIKQIRANHEIPQLNHAEPDKNSNNKPARSY